MSARGLCLLGIMLGAACSETPTTRAPAPEFGTRDGAPVETMTAGDGPATDGRAPRDTRPSDGAKPPADAADPFPLQNGKATYYAADGSGNCSFPASPGDLMVAALNTTDYQGSQTCGACVSVQGPKGSVTVRIVDRCPGCAQGHIDLSQQAFAKIADVALGVVQVKWKIVACSVTGPIRYHFKSGSSQWWTAIQVRNHRWPIKSLEAKLSSGAFSSLPRQTYNYFVAASGLGPGPYTLRVTDVLGHALTDTSIALKPDQEVAGAAQLPP